MRNRIGSNQHQVRQEIYGLKAGTWGSVFFLCALLGIVCAATRKPDVIHLVTPVAHAQALPTPTPTPTEHDEIVAYIKEVFGKDSDKAFLILTKGKKGTGCNVGENPTLKPDSHNTNADGSTDYGLFQINSYWNGFKQEVNNTDFLYDYKVNTLLAYHIFLRNNHTFARWTCGGVWGV